MSLQSSLVQTRHNSWSGRVNSTYSRVVATTVESHVTSFSSSNDLKCHTPWRYPVEMVMVGIDIGLVIAAVAGSITYGTGTHHNLTGLP
jgi:hypothetical protein